MFATNFMLKIIIIFFCALSTQSFAGDDRANNLPIAQTITENQFYAFLNNLRRLDKLEYESSNDYKLRLNKSIKQTYILLLPLDGKDFNGDDCFVHPSDLGRNIHSYYDADEQQLYPKINIFSYGGMNQLKLSCFHSNGSREGVLDLVNVNSIEFAPIHISPKDAKKLRKELFVRINFSIIGGGVMLYEQRIILLGQNILGNYICL
jgi:hypothetical protein